MHPRVCIYTKTSVFVGLAFFRPQIHWRFRPRFCLPFSYFRTPTIALVGGVAHERSSKRKREESAGNGAYLNHYQYVRQCSK